jgi:hypothetical protein
MCLVEEKHSVHGYHRGGGVPEYRGFRRVRGQKVPGQDVSLFSCLLYFYFLFLFCSR